MSTDDISRMERVIENLSANVAQLTGEVIELKTEARLRPDLQPRVVVLEQFVEQAKGAKLVLGALLTVSGMLGGAVSFALDHASRK